MAPSLAHLCTMVDSNVCCPDVVDATVPARGQDLLTVGHGTASRAELLSVLTGAGVELLVDVRRYPGSTAHPHVARDSLASWLPEGGVAYRWEPRLGGRRRVPQDVPSPDTWWTVEAFRAYAAHTRTADFSSALEGLLADSDRCTVAVLCSETLWWRCHRRLIADAAVLAGTPVTHLMDERTSTRHELARDARPDEQGRPVYDVGVLPT